MESKEKSNNAMLMIDIEDKGQGNKVAMGKIKPFYDKGLSITFNGSNNKIIFGDNIIGKSLNIAITGDDNRLIVGSKTSVNGVVILKYNKNTVSIGRFSTAEQCEIVCECGTEITIGEDCMFSTGVVIRSGDSHSIIDLQSSKRLNFAKSVVIGKHVWLGYCVSISKGVDVKANTVIGATSYVNKSFHEGNCIVAGTPAKIVKKNIIWDRRSLGDNIPESHLKSLKNDFLFLEDE